MSVRLHGFLASTCLAVPLLLAGSVHGQISFDLVIPDAVLPYDLATGIGELTIQPTFEESPLDPGFPEEVEGFSFGIAHDPAFLDVTAIQQQPILSLMNGGTGPDFWATSLLNGGVTVGAVWSYLGTEVVFFDGPTALFELSYDTNAMTLAGDTDGATTGLQWSEQLAPGPGVPPVAIVIVVGGFGQDTELFDGTITLEPVANPFVRGDFDGDGSVTFPDPLATLSYLFVTGSMVPECFDAVDADDNGSLQLPDPLLVLNYLFVPASPPPEPPFPDCGEDPSNGDPLDCTVLPPGCQ